MSRIAVKQPPSLRKHLPLLLLVMVGLAIPAALFPLSGDEAYYWDCGWHFDWASFDQPPLMLWLVRAFTQAFGHSALAVRLPSLLFTFLSGALMASWFQEQGMEVFLLLRLTPLFFFGSFYLSTDAALGFFYLLATYLFYKIREKSSLKLWLGLGACLGLGFLSKFPIVLAAVLFLFIPWKKIRLTHVLACVAAAFAFTAPVWIYAVQHDWINIIFQLFSRHHTDHALLKNLLEFWGPQFLLIGPALFPVGIWKAWRARREDTLLWMSGLIPWLFFGLLAFKAPMAPHWGAPGVQPWAALTRGSWSKQALRWVLIPSGAITALLLAVLLFPRMLIPVVPRVAAEFYGMDRLVQTVGRELRPGEVAASPGYSLVACVNFALKAPGLVRLANVDGGRHGLSYLYWQEHEAFKGKDILFFTDKEKCLDEIRPKVTSVESIIRVPIFVHGKILRTFYLAHLKNLKDDASFKP